jgi:hypothetical protein
MLLITMSLREAAWGCVTGRRGNLVALQSDRHIRPVWLRDCRATLAMTYFLFHTNERKFKTNNVIISVATARKQSRPV